MPARKYLQVAEIAAAQRGFQTIFNIAFGGIEDPVKQLAMVVQSSGYDEEYNWFGDVPDLNEWLDDRPLAKLRAESMTIVNRNYVSGLEVHINDIKDDRTGQYRPKIMELGRKAALHPGYMLGQMLLNGFDGTVVDWSDGLSYDGVYFFSASHQDGDGSAWSNLDTAALADDAYFDARAAMRQYLDENDRYALGVNPSTLVVGPSLERTALEIVGSDYRNDGNDVQIENVMRGTAKIIISDALVGSYANYWFLCDLTRPIKPLIFQERERASFEAADDINNDDVFMRGKLKYGVSARYGFGYGDPHFCYGSNGTV